MVGGSDLKKQREQLGETVLDIFNYTFPENGLIAFKNGQQFASTSFKEFLGEEKLKKFINFTLLYLANIDIPVKRGTFIEFRTGMLNISPVGRNCSQQERDEFEEFDKIHNVRAKMVKVLQHQFPDYGLKYSIGGQISFDVFPIGWDKTFCLQYLKADGYDDIYFFGDKTFEGGNDFEIFSHPEVKGNTVNGPHDTMAQCTKLFLA
jgi:phosphomannomutase